MNTARVVTTRMQVRIYSDSFRGSGFPLNIDYRLRPPACVLVSTVRNGLVSQPVSQIPAHVVGGISDAGHPRPLVTIERD